MYTDWILIHRLRQELGRAIIGGRVQAAGHLPDGRFALEIWNRGVSSLVAFDVFAATPVVTIEDAELTIESEPGFVRRTGAALRNMTIASVHSRRGDRVLRIEFSARSRFGVQSGYALIAELVPKFGNLILVKDQTVVVALKEFTPAENARRPIAAGERYEPPPLDLQPRESVEAFLAAPTLKGYRAAFPLLPPLIARSLFSEDFADAQQLVERATAFLSDLDAVAAQALFVYRKGGALVQAHVVALHQFAELECSREADLLALLAESRRENLTSHESDRTEKHRRALARALRDREERLKKELADLDKKFERAQGREALRSAGQTIFATLHERPAPEQEAAKEQAAEHFARYRKLTASLPHMQTRRAELNAALAIVRELQWEVERAADAEMEDVAVAVRHLNAHRTSKSAGKAVAKKRKPLAISTPGGSRILIGRSPLENAELTFRIAKPDDIWFHAQNIPGAHVILQRDDREEPSENDVRTAASIAAFYSKAKTSPKVLVDYTQRKFVRKQPAAPPGLVFYTNPKSIYVEPKEPVF